MFKPFKKKGQVQAGVSGVIFLVVGLGVATMVQIFVGILGGKTYQLVEPDIDAITQATTKLNDTLAPLNNTEINLGHRDINTGTLVVFNNTNGNTGIQIGSNNFTINGADGKITFTILDNATNGAYMSPSTVGINYTYGNGTIRSAIKSGIASSFEANQQTGELMPVVALAFMVILVLGLLMSMFFTTSGGLTGGGSVL